jgi:hypothetical protein
MTAFVMINVAVFNFAMRFAPWAHRAFERGKSVNFQLRPPAIPGLIINLLCGGF